jgi:hypothetical protein
MNINGERTIDCDPLTFDPVRFAYAADARFCPGGDDQTAARFLAGYGGSKHCLSGQSPAMRQTTAAHAPRLREAAVALRDDHDTDLLFVNTSSYANKKLFKGTGGKHSDNDNTCRMNQGRR